MSISQLRAELVSRDRVVYIMATGVTGRARRKLSLKEVVKSVINDENWPEDDER